MNIQKAALASLLAFGIAAPAFAQAADSATPGVEQHQPTLQNTEAAAKSDGKVTAKERHKLKRTAKHDSAATAKAKHNKKTDPNPAAAN